MSALFLGGAAKNTGHRLGPSQCRAKASPWEWWARGLKSSCGPVERMPCLPLPEAGGPWHSVACRRITLVSASTFTCLFYSFCVLFSYKVFGFRILAKSGMISSLGLYYKSKDSISKYSYILKFPMDRNIWGNCSIHYIHKNLSSGNCRSQKLWPDYFSMIYWLWNLGQNT